LLDIYISVFDWCALSRKKIIQNSISTIHNEDLCVMDVPTKFQPNRTTNDHPSELLIEDWLKLKWFEKLFKEGQCWSCTSRLNESLNWRMHRIDRSLPICKPFECSTYKEEFHCSHRSDLCFLFASRLNDGQLGF
jgi:hypothetical protein